MVDDTETRATVERAPAGAAAKPSGIGPTEPTETIVPMWGGGSVVSLPDPGYQLGDLIGHGGMGEVLVAQDQRIGREVAVKRIRSQQPSPDTVVRFLREARIQARLDHPAIVPVYELGTDADGRPFFTMKRLAGETLARKLEDRRPIQPLLRAFVDVCLALQFAHARGVVHRDLKPTNIMLGDYGEVYVLDWGVARVLTEPQKRRSAQLSVAEDVDEGTTAGAILGTPGYMAPEQVEGNDVGTAADIYALGAILFEILAGEPLHPRGEAALASTLSKPQQAPARRAVDRTIPPELDAVCFDTLALDPASRPTAREIASRVQAYLDGDRDLERRRALAGDYIASAQSALASGDHGRAGAMRDAGRALALDPQSAEAAALVASLILEPPKQLPPELVASLEGEDTKFQSARSRVGMYAYLILFAWWAVIPFMHVKNWIELISFFGLLALGALYAARQMTSPAGRRAGASVTMTMTGLVALAFSRIAGPFMLTPIVVCVIMMSISAVPGIMGWRLVAWAVVVTLLPIGLEAAGVIHHTYALQDGALIVVSDIFDMRSTLDSVVLIATHTIFVVAAAMVAIAITRRRIGIQRELHIRAWHLRQLLPRDWNTRPKMGE